MLFLVRVEAQNLLVVFKLKFESKVGTDIGSAGADMFDGRCKGLLIFFHVVGNNEGGRLNRAIGTLEMPAPQWTRTAPRFRSS